MKKTCDLKGHREAWPHHFSDKQSGEYALWEYRVVSKVDKKTWLSGKPLFKKYFTELMNLS